MLTFNKEDHKYFWNLQPVPSVTQILDPCTRWFTDEARDRGKLVHKLTELHDNGGVKESSIDERLRPYLVAYIKFLSDTGWVPVEREVMGYSEIWDYAGTWDGIYQKRNGGYALVDIKSGKAMPYVALQLAGYKELVKDRFPGALLHSLELRRDGKYRLSDAYTDPNYWAEFANLVTARRIRGKYGILHEEGE